MEYELGRRSLKDIVVDGFKLYKSGFPKLLLAPLIVIPGAIIWGVIVLVILFFFVVFEDTGKLGENITYIMYILLALFFTTAILLLPGIALAISAIVHVICEIYLGNAINFGGAFRSAMRRFVAVYSVLLIFHAFWILMAFAFAVLQYLRSTTDSSTREPPYAIAMLAMIVLTLYLTYFLFVFAPLVAHLEGIGPIASLKRGLSLVTRNWWATFGHMVALYALAFGISLALIPLGLILPGLGWVIAEIVFAPLFITYYMLIYFQARYARDGANTFTRDVLAREAGILFATERPSP